MADDLLQALRDGPDGEAKSEVPSMEQLLNAVDTMKDINDSERETLKKTLMEQMGIGKGANRGRDEASLMGHSGTIEMLMLLGMVLLVLSVLVFFGYKLYISLVEKERRREEKRKLKMQRKKK